MGCESLRLEKVEFSGGAAGLRCQIAVGKGASSVHQHGKAAFAAASQSGQTPGLAAQTITTVAVVSRTDSFGVRVPAGPRFYIYGPV